MPEKGFVKAGLLLGAEVDCPLPNATVPEEGVQLRPLLPEQFQGGVELAFVLFHERETATLENDRKSLWRHVEAAEGDDLAEALFQVARQLLVGQEQDVRVVPVRPPAADMPEPGSEIDLAAQEVVKELSEGPLVAVVAAVEVVARQGHVLAVAGDVDVLARAFRDPA